MKYIKSRQSFENSTGSLIINVDAQNRVKEAFSYRWWHVAFTFGKYLVVNNSRYSNSTSKHQGKVRSFIYESGDNRPIININNCTENLTKYNLGDYLQSRIDSIKKDLIIDDSILLKNPKTVLRKLSEIPSLKVELKKFQEYLKYYNKQMKKEI